MTLSKEMEGNEQEDEIQQKCNHSERSKIYWTTSHHVQGKASLPTSLLNLEAPFDLPVKHHMRRVVVLVFIK